MNGTKTQGQFLRVVSEETNFSDLLTFFSAPAVLQACLSSGLNLEESAAKAWMNWRLYSIFTTQLKCSAKRDILNHFSTHRTMFIRGRYLFHRNARGQQLSVQKVKHRASMNIVW